MRIALLSNTRFIDHELPLFRHLVVGLMDEQMRVVQVVPEAVPLEELSVFGEQVRWHEHAYRLVNRWRVHQLHDPLEELEVDLVHVLDAPQWASGLALANRLEVPAVLTLTCAADLDRLPQCLRKWGLPLPGRSGATQQPIAVAAATGPLAEAAAERCGGAGGRVEHVPLGVHVPKDPPVREREPEGPLCVVLTVTGAEDAATLACLEALAAHARDGRSLQCFLDCFETDAHRLWRHAHRLGLLGHLSTVPHKLGHRELLLKADLLLQPQRLGSSRGMVLQAFAGGVPLAAAADPWEEALIDGTTALVIPNPTMEDWRAVLDEADRNPDRLQAFADSAREWVKEHRPMSQTLKKTLALYESLEHKEKPTD